MELANYINYAMKSILKNPILEVLTEIKKSDSAFGKDAYYRFIKESRYNWRKFLMLSATAFLQKIKPLHKTRLPNIKRLL